MKRIIMLAMLSLAVASSALAQTPVVTDVHPDMNRTGLYPTTHLRVRFDMNIDDMTLDDSSIVVYGSYSGYHSCDITWNPSTLTATIQPDDPFARGEVVTVSVTRDVESVIGDSLDEPYVWNFIIGSAGGSGTFGTAVGHNTSSSRPGFIQAADLDNDSHIDLATRSNYPDYNHVTTWINDGSASFSGTNRATNDSQDAINDLITIDIDKDYDMDLLVEWLDWSSSNFEFAKISNPFGATIYPGYQYDADYANAGYVMTDFDGDGWMDAVQSFFDNSTVNSIRVLGYNQFTSMFDSEWTHSTAPDYHTLPCAADFNNDGKIDFATATDSDMYITVWLNQGSWSFTLDDTYSAGRVPVDMRAADLNGDGYVDLVTTNDTTDDISVLLNDGTGAFDPVSVYDTDTEPKAMTLADLDADGDLDVVTANPAAMTVTVLLNDGIGGFDARTEFTSGQTNRLPKQVTAADFDGDGDIDIATSNGGYYSGYIYILPNMTQPQVVSVTPDLNELDVDPSTDITATFDIDMDGATIGSSSFVVSTRTGGFVSGAVSYDGPSRTATFNPSGAFDDGELVSVSLTPGIESADGVPLVGYVWSFTVEAEAGSAGFNGDVLYTLQDQPRNIQAADLNGDGHIDLAAVNRNSHTMSVLINNGDGTYASQVTYATGGYPLYLFAADLDDDGDVDIAVPSSNDDDIRIFRNNGSGAFPGWTDYPTDTYPSSIDGGDLDGDGDIDLITGSGSDVAVLLNSGSGAFSMYEEYGTGSPVIRAYLFDADNDGALDIGAVQVNLNQLVILMNSGAGTFSVGQTLATGEDPNYMCAADFDGDGDLDVAVGNRADDDVSYFRGGGNGFFTAMGTYPVAGGPVEIVATDLDADGDMDLATANYGVHNVSVLINNGSGSFTSGGSFGTGGGPYGLCSADLDGNGTMDLATANFSGDNASVLTNINSMCVTLPITATDLDIPFVVSGDTIAMMNFSSEALDSVNVCLYPGQLPSPIPAGTDWVPRLYSITPYPSAAAFNAELTLFYEQAEFDASGLAEEWALHAYRYNAGIATWELVDGTVNNVANAVICEDVTGFSIWGFSDSEALVDDEAEPVPAVTTLMQNYPNPFNPSTRIEYTLSRDAEVKLAVYDVLGREIRVLVDGREKAGYRSVGWDGKDGAGGAVVSGIYFYRLIAGDFIETRKMVLLR